MDKKSTINLCTYYILPLLRLNIRHFGGVGNFVDSYIYSTQIIVKVKNSKNIGEYWNLAQYITDFDQDGHTFIVLEIAEEFHDTLVKFKKGKYSQFDEKHKTLIKEHSGLAYKIPSSQTPGKVVSARQLLALDLDKDLRENLEKDLNVKIPLDAELWSVPEDSNYMEI